MGVLKNLKKPLIWSAIIIVITVTLYVRGLTVGPHMIGNEGSVLGTKVQSPGFGPLLDK